MQKIVRNGDVSLFTESFGNKGGRPLLLISGAMAPSRFWPDSFCESLASRGYFVIRFDNRDFGLSTHFTPSRPGSEINCPYSIFDMVLDCVSILDAHGIDKCHVAGHSLGGSLVQLLATQHPNRVLTATALSSPILATGCPGLKKPDPEIERQTWDIFMKNPMHADSKLGIPAFMDVWRYLNGAYPLDEQMAEGYTAKIYETETIEPAWNHTAVQADVPDIFDDLGKCNVPLLFVHGGKDNLIQNVENVQILANNIGHVSFEILEQAGHVFFSKSVWDDIEKILLRHTDFR